MIIRGNKFWVEKSYATHFPSVTHELENNTLQNNIGRHVIGDNESWPKRSKYLSFCVFRSCVRSITSIKERSPSIALFVSWLFCQGHKISLFHLNWNVVSSSVFFQGRTILTKRWNSWDSTN